MYQDNDLLAALDSIIKYLNLKLELSPVITNKYSIIKCLRLKLELSLHSNNQHIFFKSGFPLYLHVLKLISFQIIVSYLSCLIQPHKRQLTSKLNSKTVLVLPFLPLRLHFLFIFYLPRCT